MEFLKGFTGIGREGVWMIGLIVVGLIALGLFARKFPAVPHKMTMGRISSEQQNTLPHRLVEPTKSSTTTVYQPTSFPAGDVINFLSKQPGW